MAFERAHQRLRLVARPGALAEMGPPPLFELGSGQALEVLEPQIEALVPELLEEEPRLPARLPAS
jgi:hypothetical protein